jgi:hypothetical protein
MTEIRRLHPGYRAAGEIGGDEAERHESRTTPL